MKKTPPKKKATLLRITGEQIGQYLSRSGINRNSLARLLNVNPASVTRWIADKYPQSPTSTTYLALIPLLLSEGITLLPDPSDRELEAVIQLLTASDLVEAGRLDKPQRLATLKKQIAMRSSPEVQASKRLFLALAKAWHRMGLLDLDELTEKEPIRKVTRRAIQRRKAHE